MAIQVKCTDCNFQEIVSDVYEAETCVHQHQKAQYGHKLLVDPARRNWFQDRFEWLVDRLFTVENQDATY